MFNLSLWKFVEYDVSISLSSAQLEQLQIMYKQFGE